MNTSKTAYRQLALVLAVMLSGLVANSASAQTFFQNVSTSAGWVNNNAESWGASWGDFNGDGYPDIFFQNHRMRASLYQNNGNGTFTEVSKQVDLSKIEGWTGGRPNVDQHGVSWGDVDNDGDQDLMITVSSSMDRLLINTDGKFTDRSVALGMGNFIDIGTRQNLFVDYNGDGRLDIVTTSLYGSLLHPQLPDGTFYSNTTPDLFICGIFEGQWAHLMDLNPAPGLEFICAPRNGSYPKVNTFIGGVPQDVSSLYTQYYTVNDGVTLDFNRDLRPDVFLIRSSEHPSGLYQAASNKLEAQFITPGGRTLTFKSTGILTVIVSLDEGQAASGEPQYIDIGSGRYHPTSLTFTLNRNETRNRGIVNGASGMNIGYDAGAQQWRFFKNNSSWSNAYVQVTSTAAITNATWKGLSESDIGLAPYLVANNLTGLTDVAATSGFTEKLRCQGAASGDFDNDMDEDLFVVCAGAAHNVPDRLYLNNGSGQFTQVPNAGGAAGPTGSAVFDKAGTGESAVTADYDLDGRLDIAVTNGNNMRPIYVNNVYMGGPKQLFRNVVANGNHWIQLDLVGTTSNRDAVGSKVLVTSGGVTQYREQGGGYHRWSQNFTRVHVGLGTNTTADVAVTWPDGTITNYTELAADHVYQVKQDGTSASIH